MINNLGSDDNFIIYGFPNTGKSTLNEKASLTRIFDTDDSPKIFVNGLASVEEFRVSLVTLILDFSSPRIILTNLPSALKLSDNYEYFAFLPNIKDLRNNRHISALGLSTVLGWYIDAIRSIKESIERNRDIRLFITQGYYISDIISFNPLGELQYNDYHLVKSGKIEVLNALENQAINLLISNFIN